MQKNKHKQDPGTYSTGSTQPPKSSSPLVALLLAAVIVLGGIASGMGLLNIRLLLALKQQEEESYVLQVGQQDAPATTAPIQEEPVPTLPTGTLPQLQLQPNDQAEPPKQNPLEQSRQTVVGITATDGLQEQTGSTGIVVSAQGYILTNARAIANAQKIYITLHDGTQQRAALVGSDPLLDLAVLYIQATGLTAAEFADDQTLAQGSQVTAIGHPRAQDGAITSTTGVIYAVRRNVPAFGQKLTLLQTTAAGNGDASGAVFNGQGKVIGILCPQLATFLDMEQADAGFILPSATIKQVVDQLISQGYAANRPCLGVTAEEITDLYQEYWKIPNGLLITAGSAATGLQEGDILLQLGGIALQSTNDLHRALFNHGVGSSVEAIVYRDGVRVCLQLRLQAAAPSGFGNQIWN